jgi:ATP-dependent RNA helicase DDX55/SPB4
MPELKNWDGDKSLGVTVDMDEYAYKDKAREKVRRLAMEEAKKAGPYVPSEEVLRKRREKEAWSRKHDKQDTREQRRDRKRRKRDAERTAKMTPAEREQEKEVEALVEEVKRRKKAADEAEFEGFPD